jgi:sporulation protein YqfC
MKSHKSNQNNYIKKQEQLVERLELPKDLFLGMPLLSLDGNRTLCIVNHRGIVKYSRETIIVASRSYGIQITGRELSIPSFNRDQVEITGYLQSVSFLL